MAQSLNSISKEEKKRREFHELLKRVSGLDRVYFQAPQKTRLTYPCIIYDVSYQRITHADNRPYVNRPRYNVTVIYENPDCGIPYRVAEISSASFDRTFKADGLYHTSYSIYF